jgi:hypothetical protein
MLLRLQDDGMSRIALCHVCLGQHFHPKFPILRLHRIALFCVGNTVKANIALQNPRDFRLIVLARAREWIRRSYVTE